MQVTEDVEKYMGFPTREKNKKTKRSIYQVSALVGGGLASAPLLGFLLMFLLRRNSGVFLLAGSLTTLAIPGEYVAAVVSGQGHGSSMHAWSTLYRYTVQFSLLWVGLFWDTASP